MTLFFKTNCKLVVKADREGQRKKTDDQEGLL